MQKAMNVPVVPVATNLGCFWQQEEMRKTPGVAVVEFLEPILPGLDKLAFLDRLSRSIESRTSDLIAEGLLKPPNRVSSCRTRSRSSLP